MLARTSTHQSRWVSAPLDQLWPRGVRQCARFPEGDARRAGRLDPAPAIAEDGVPAGSYQEGEHDEHNAQDDLTLNQLDDSGDGKDDGDEPQDEIHGCLIPTRIRSKPVGRELRREDWCLDTNSNQ